MRIGSLFSGIGGLDLAAEAAFGGQTVWHCEIDKHARAVLAARWPEAVLHDDVRTLTAGTVQAIDVLTGGFPCQDLSVAGKRAGLDGARSGLYGEMLRIAAELQPVWIVFENVPPLLKYRARVQADLERMGWGSIWQVCEASDVGAPHRRQRVFVVARRGMQAHVMLPRPSPQRDMFAPDWQGAGVGALWPTPTTGGHATMYAQGGEPLGHAARWPTPTVKGNDNRAGLSPTSGDGLATAVKAWPTPMAADSARASETMVRGNPTLLGTARWPTPMAADGTKPKRSEASVAAGGGEMLSNAAGAVANTGVLNPDWVELLMGLPIGWTDPDRTELRQHAWPAGRGEPQREHEPPRLVPPRTVANRGARLKALGNAVVWQQAHAAIVRAKKVAPGC